MLTYGDWYYTSSAPISTMQPYSGFPNMWDRRAIVAQTEKHKMGGCNTPITLSPV